MPVRLAHVRSDQHPLLSHRGDSLAVEVLVVGFQVQRVKDTSQYSVQYGSGSMTTLGAHSLVRLLLHLQPTQ